MDQFIAVAHNPIQVDTAARGRFMRQAGLLYGAIFAIGFAFALWGPDAIALQQAFVYLWWGKFAIGFVLILPVCLFAGWLSGSVSQSAVGIGLWIVACPIIILIAGHVPYDGVSWLASLNDPYPTAQVMYPFTAPTAAITGLCMLMGAGIGLFMGLISLFAIGRAWDRSTRSNRLSLRSILMLGLSLIPIVPLAPIVDYYIDAPRRFALVDVQTVIDLALDPRVNLDSLRMPFLKNLRGDLSANYSLMWVSSTADEQMSNIDVQFDNGLLLRCDYNFGNVSLCTRLNQNLNEWMTELMTTGHLSCKGCSVRTDRVTRRWLAATLPTLNGSASLLSVSLLKHQSGWVYERAVFDNGQLIDCRFSGDSPIIVDLCVEIKQQG